MIPAGIMDLVNRDKNGWHVYASATVIVGESYNLANPYFKATFRVKDGVIGGTDVSPWIDQSRAILAGARLLRYSLVFDEAKIKVKGLDSISITTPPTTTVYTEGDTFDGTGMVVTAKYNDGTEQAVTGYTCQPNGALATSDNEITVSYEENGVTKTATQTITVNAKPVSNEFTVTVNGGKAIPAKAKAGETVTIKADSKSGYTFKSWNVTAGTVTLTNRRMATTTFQMPAENVTLLALYSNNNSGGSGGSVTVLTYTVDVKKAENGILIASLTSASKGQTVTVTARPHTGYVLDKVTAKTSNGVTVDLTKKVEDKFTFTMPNSKVKVEAVFLPKEKETEEHTQKETEEEPEKNTEENSPVAEEKSNYTDVDATRWSKGAIDYVYSKGLMFGVSETEFGPAISTSRGMIVTALYRLEGKPAVEGENPFCDVAAGSYYEKAITWAVTNNIVAGYGEGEFGPDDTITREQLAAILYRYASFKGYDVSVAASLTGYDDANKVSAYAVPAMQWATGAGLIKGDENKLMPTDKATREQIAAILYRFCEIIIG